MLKGEDFNQDRYGAFFCFLMTYKPRQLKNFAHNVGFDFYDSSSSKKNLCMELLCWLHENEEVLFNIKKVFSDDEIPF